MCGLLAVAGCPQVKDGDFALIDPPGGDGVDASPTRDCGGGVASLGCGGAGSPPSTLDASDVRDAGSAAGGDAGSDPSSECEGDSMRGPNGDCYFADATASTWSEARTSCERRGAGWDLAAPRSTAENEFIVGLTGYEAWIGGNDLASEGTWIWVRDSVPFFTVGGDAGAPAFTFWNNGEPNDLGGSDCLRVLTTGLWADWACDDATYGHVCQRELPGADSP